MTKSTRATDIDKRLNRAAQVAEALVQSRNAREEIENQKGETYTGKHRKS